MDEIRAQRGSPDSSERPPEPFARAFKAAVEGTDLHARVRAAAMRAAKSLGIEDRLAAKLPRE